MMTAIRILIGALIGGGIGFAMYRFVGCRTGACPLTSNPYTAVIVWSLIGGLLAVGSAGRGGGA